jgi:hypothetical protein
MRKSFLHITVFVALAMLVIPQFAGALALGEWPSASKPLLSCTGDGSGGTKCTSLCDLVTTMGNIINLGLTFLLEIFAPLLIIYGGFVWFFSGGSPERIALGKRIFIGTVVGILIALAGYAIVDWFMKILGASGIWGDTSACHLFDLK